MAKVKLNYHCIVAPQADVFRLGGALPFQGFGRKNEGQRNLLVLSETVLDSLRRMKEDSDELASEALNYLDREVKDYRKVGKDVWVGSTTENLDVAFVHKEFANSPDMLERIVNQYFSAEEGRLIYVTDDSASSIALKSRGLKVGGPEFLEVSTDVTLEGLIDGSQSLFAQLDQGPVTLEQASPMMKGRKFYPHQFLHFTPPGGDRYAQVISVDYGLQDGYLELVPKEMTLKIGQEEKDSVLGIKPLDMEQFLALQYGLLNPDVSLFFLMGRDGAGKTLLSYAAAVEQVLHYAPNDRDKQTISRTSFFDQIVLIKPVDKDLRVKDSVYHAMRPYLDAFERAHATLVQNLKIEGFPFEDMFKDRGSSQDGLPNRHFYKTVGGGTLPSDPVIKLPFGDISGSSFTNSYIIVDEAQNFTPHELRVILRQIGRGSKMIILGDPNQVSNPRCTMKINGLTHAVKHYLGQPYSSLINLGNNWRSSAAAIANSMK